MASRDRRTAVLQSSAYNGIDFVEIANQQQTTLNVHFLNAVEFIGTLTGQPTITGGETIPTVAVLPIADTDWGFDDGHVVLTLRVPAPGDFSAYTLTIPSPALDRFFDHVAFSFKAGCPSDLDCEPAVPPCPPPAGDVPPINYLAKDFLSFRQALLDFSALRYPQWQERSEADFGVMFLEALSALADDLSYTQDRIAAEATLATATQRRSVVRHARLVDYEPHAGGFGERDAAVRRRSRAWPPFPTASRSSRRRPTASRSCSRPAAACASRPTRIRAEPACRRARCGTRVGSRRTGSTTASGACRPARRRCTSSVAATTFNPASGC